MTSDHVYYLISLINLILKTLIMTRVVKNENSTFLSYLKTSRTLCCNSLIVEQSRQPTAIADDSLRMDEAH